MKNSIRIAVCRLRFESETSRLRGKIPTHYVDHYHQKQILCKDTVHNINYSYLSNHYNF